MGQSNFNKGKTRQEIINGYDDYVAKFKDDNRPKTTDDTFTPPRIYKVVREWVVKKYDLQDRKIVRPFFPGGDYEHFDYPDNCVVIDNPPFSILSKITTFYLSHGIDFFLFCPSLTCFSNYVRKDFRERGTVIYTGSKITYENGAKVDTSFLTSLDSRAIATAPELSQSILDANMKSQNQNHIRYIYPANVLSVRDMEKMKRSDFELRRHEFEFVRQLECQRPIRKSLYGGGMFIPDSIAAMKPCENPNGIQLTLSERESEIIKRLNER